MTLGPTGTPYSQMPKAARREWIVPKRAKEGFVAFAIIALAVVGASTFVKHWSSRVDRAKGMIEADDLKPEPALPIALPARGGGKIDLASMKGKLVLVNFWASWCAPCRDEEPSLDALARRYDPGTFEVLAVSVDDDWAAVDGFFGKRAPAYRVALDVDKRTSLAYGTSKFPESYLVDANGVVQLKFVGPRNWTEPAVFTVLESMGAKPRAN